MNFLHKINYMKSARYWVIFSVVLSVVSLAALGLIGLNTGIDFTGGNMFDVQYEAQVTQADVTRVVENLVGKNYQVQSAQPKTDCPTCTDFLIRTPQIEEATRTQLLTDLEGLGKYKLVGEENVSGSVSGELTRKATLAILLAALLQIVYIWIRFDFKFGITAVLALLHDVIITLGLLTLFRVQINSSFVAAILTVLGYSMNDTVVVIDRIRENLSRRKKGEALEQLTTRSIQEVITRSLFTGVSVQMMLISMLIFGGDSIWDMAMTLLIGITSGTYSSIFIASALWLFWNQWADKRKKAAPHGKPARA